MVSGVMLEYNEVKSPRFPLGISVHPGRSLVHPTAESLNQSNSLHGSNTTTSPVIPWAY